MQAFSHGAIVQMLRYGPSNVRYDAESGHPRNELEPLKTGTFMWEQLWE